MKFRNKHNSNDETFWLSATDMMAGILVVVLLLLLLFLLYLNMSTDVEYTPLDETQPSVIDETHLYDYPSEYYQRETETYDWHDDDGGGGQTEATVPTMPTENSDSGRYEEGEEDKSAVFVTVVDADSGNVIKKSGIRFELYAYKNGIGGLQVLHSYYQEKIEYKKFETGNNGTFYLPEKITRGTYSLHNLSAPEGYYIEENTDFTIDDVWDWPEPYMVTVTMKPIKKVISVSAEDAETSEGIENAVFRVIAANDITAVDGTVRYAAGDVVDEIKTDDKGYAESKELYIGHYYVKQMSAPEYYAVDRTVLSAMVNETTGTDTGLIRIECAKTSVTVRLTDERTEEPIAGAVYAMEGRDDLVTDENGEFVVSELAKTSSYKLTVVSVPEGYIKKDKELSFKVDNYGLVSEKAAAVLDDTAYTISLTVEAKDLIFNRKVKGVDLQLLDENLKVIDEWTTNDETYIISGLKEGKYYAQRAGAEDTRVSLHLADKSELQTVTLHLWDTVDLFALLMAGGAVVILGLVFVFFLSRKKKVKTANEK